MRDDNSKFQGNIDFFRGHVFYQCLRTNFGGNVHEVGLMLKPVVMGWVRTVGVPDSQD